MKRVKRYSEAFKLQVVREIQDEGLSLKAICRKYDIGNTMTVRRWLKQAGRSDLGTKVVRIETMDDVNRIKELEKEVTQLKVALADEHLKNVCLESLVSLAKEKLDIDLKKNFGSKVSNESVIGIRPAAPKGAHGRSKK